MDQNWLQEEQDEHGQGKWEGKQKGPQWTTVIKKTKVITQAQSEIF
jgi:hypothetical protein